MAHDEHFLRRLDRVSPGEVELALGLYRDPQVVKAILEEAKCDPASGRIAIALGDGSGGPWAVVAKDGHFVTCLSEEMRHELPVVSRDTLAEVATRVQRLREYVSEAKRLTGIAAKEKREGALIKRLRDRRVPVSREEFRALASLEPALGPYFLREYIGVSMSMLKAHGTLSTMKEPRMREARDFLAVCAGVVHALGPMAVLATMGGERRFSMLPEGVRKDLSEFAGVTLADNERVAAPLLKAVWGAVRFGEAVLPAYEANYTAVPSATELRTSVLTQVVFALRHPALEPRVRAVLSREPVPGDPKYAAEVMAVQGPLRAAALEVLDHRDAAHARHRELGAQKAVAMTAALPDGHPCAWRDPEEVPDEVAWPLFIESDGDTYNEETMALMLTAAPFLARAEAEDLFLPKAFVEAAVKETTDDDVRRYALRRERKGETIRAGARAKPNEPCPCGSGKKHKRCCAGKSAA